MKMIVLYISGNTKGVYSVDPSVGPEAKVVVQLPDGMPIAFLNRQIDSLTNSLFDGSTEAEVQNLILEIRIGQ
jgi:hypothetical protein